QLAHLFQGGGERKRADGLARFGDGGEPAQHVHSVIAVADGPIEIAERIRIRPDRRGPGVDQARDQETGFCRHARPRVRDHRPFPPGRTRSPLASKKSGATISMATSSPTARSACGSESVITSVFATVTCRWRSEEHTSELQSRGHLVCRLLL